MAATPVSILSPTEVWDRLDPLSPELDADPVAHGLADLPYRLLEGPGFERLCYQLLVAEGKVPRFFGRRGQRDYGVDIIVETAGARTLYQCKNLAAIPSWTALRDAVEQFEHDWLGEAGLPSPSAFVYCCPQPLDDKDLGQRWIEYRDSFQSRTGITLDLWGKHYLDARLRRLPDLVAGLFSDTYGEHLCGQDDWRATPWTRVSTKATGHLPVRRFLDDHRAGRIHVGQAEQELFGDILSRAPVLVIRGLPGVGKTVTGLQLASGLREPIRRLYYATLKDVPDGRALWGSVERRRSLPAIFFLDDCHLDPELTGRVLERLHPLLADPHRRISLILAMRDSLSGAEGEYTWDWLAKLSEDRCVIDLVGDLKRVRAVVEHRRPDLVGIGPARLERLHHQTGGDLLLLDAPLAGIDNPSDLDRLLPDSLYCRIRQQYFNNRRWLPTILRLACLAQFDLMPLASFFDDDWRPGERAVAEPLMAELYPPPRYLFLHASLAELIVRALLSCEVEPGKLEAAVVATTVQMLLAYLDHLLSDGRAARDPSTTLQDILRARLRLMDAAGELELKTRFFGDAKIQGAIGARLDRFNFSFLLTSLRNLRPRRPSSAGALPDVRWRAVSDPVPAPEEG